MRLVVSVFISLIVFTFMACSGGETTGTAGSEADGVSAAETGTDGSGTGESDDSGASDESSEAADADEGATEQQDDVSLADDGSVVADDAAPGPNMDDAAVQPALDAVVNDDVAESATDAGGPLKIDASGADPDVVTENQPPVAVDDSAATEADESVKIPVLLNDSDVDGDKLEIVEVSQGVNGMVEIIEGIGPLYDAVEYTPLNPSFIGTDSFTYTITDGQGHEATATVAINIVEPAPDPILTIISPEHGEIIAGDTATIVFEIVGCNFVLPSIDEFGCHGHKSLDGAKYTTSYGHYTILPFDVGPLTNGQHTFVFELIANIGDDKPWVPSVSATVTFEVVDGASSSNQLDVSFRQIEYWQDNGELLLGTSVGIYTSDVKSGGLKLLYDASPDPNIAEPDGPDFVSLVQNPFDPHGYFASGHWPDGGYDNWGLMSSSDSGVSWVNVSLTGVAAFSHLAMSAEQEGLLVGVWDGQIYVSVDSGVTWETYAWDNPVAGIEIAAAAGPVLFLASDAGLERLVLPSMESTTIFSADITTIEPSGDGYIYATSDGLLHECDASWVSCLNSEGPSLNVAKSILVDPDNSDMIDVLTSASELFRSDDGGATWELFAEGQP